MDALIEIANQINLIKVMHHGRKTRHRQTWFISTIPNSLPSYLKMNAGEYLLCFMHLGVDFVKE